MGNLRFETLQLHVGQETPDIAQMHVQSRSMPPHLMYFVILPMRQHVLILQMQGIFTEG